MSKIVLHIGFPRTATTWLQSNFHSSEEVIYLGIFNPRSMYKLRWQFESLDTVIRAIKGKIEHCDIDPVELEKDFENFVKTLPEYRQEQTIVMSNETISRPWSQNPNWRSDFVATVSRYFPTAEILITTRTQAGIASSLYRGYWYGGGRQTMREWLESGGGSYDVSFWSRWDISSLYEALAEFYENRMVVIPFEYLKTNPGAYYSEIANLTGMGQYVNDHSKVMNQSVKKNPDGLLVNLIKKLSRKVDDEMGEPRSRSRDHGVYQKPFRSG